MTPEQDQVVIDGLWQTIKVLHEGATVTIATLEWFYDHVPLQHRAEAARRIDLYHSWLGKCDKLIAPMRKIMEGDQ